MYNSWLGFSMRELFLKKKVKLQQLQPFLLQFLTIIFISYDFTVLATVIADIWECCNFIKKKCDGAKKHEQPDSFLLLLDTEYVSIC